MWKLQQKYSKDIEEEEKIVDIQLMDCGAYVHAHVEGEGKWQA